MAITRAELEAVLIRRCGKKMAFVGMDATTANGTNADLNDAIVDALAGLGIVPADLSNVVDADLAGVPNDQAGATRGGLTQLRDYAELRVLETVQGNFDQPDQTADASSQQALGKLYDSWEKTIARKRVQVAAQYGIGLGTLKSGTINLNIAGTA